LKAYIANFVSTTSVSFSEALFTQRLILSPEIEMNFRLANYKDVTFSMS
jgi:uncharacterized protein involved in copper resistance